MEGYNLMILGKSGVGKSSLLNYLFEDENMAKTGSGEPVTKQGFHLKYGNINGKNVNIYDSWGLEPGKTNIWLKDFENFIENKRVEKDIKKWIHTVIFCISAEGERIEPFEKEVLKFLKNEKLNPVIVITKADADKEKVFKKEVLRITGKEPIEVCSVEKITGLGNNKSMTKGYGRDEVIQNILKNSVDSYKDRFEYIKNRILLERARSGESEIMNYVKKEIKKVESFINNISESDSKKISNSVFSKLQSYDTNTEIMIERLLMEAEDFYKDKILLTYKKTSNQSFPTIRNKPTKDATLGFWEWILVPFVIVPVMIGESWTYFLDESKYDFEERVRKIVHKHFEKTYHNI